MTTCPASRRWLAALVIAAGGCGDGPTAAPPAEPALVFHARPTVQHAGDIYSMQLDGSGLTNLTLGPEDHWEPEWLADGRILFRRYLRPGATSEHVLLTMNADGSDVRALGVEGVAGGYPPQVAPDARRYAVAASDPAGGIAVYVREVGGTGTGVRVAKPAPSAIESVAGWSVDGRRLAISSGAPFFGSPAAEPTGYAGLYLVDADGTNRQRLTNLPFNVIVGTGGAAWSPDGTQLAVVISSSAISGDPTLDGIWLVNTSGTGSTQLPNTAGASSPVAWAPDGRRIAYNTRQGNRLAVVRVPEGGPPTYVPRPTTETWGPPSWRRTP